MILIFNKLLADGLI